MCAPTDTKLTIRHPGIHPDDHDPKVHEKFDSHEEEMIATIFWEFERVCLLFIRTFG